MAYTPDQIYEAMRKADAAGDGAAVKALAGQLPGAKAAPAKPPPPKDNSKARGLLLGAEKPLDKLSQLAMEIPGVAAFDKWAANATGTETVAELTGRRKDQRANNTRTGYQTLGNIAGTLPTLAIPGGALAQGGATGAMLSDKATLGGTAVDAATGAATGYGAGKVLSGMGALAKGVTDPALRALHKAGIPLTLGQIASAGKGTAARWIAKGEEALTGVPFLGDVINGARDRGTRAVNVAVGNRILANIGEKLPKGVQPGHDMVTAIKDRVSAKYQALIPQLRATYDPIFKADLQAAAKKVPSFQLEKQFLKDLNGVLGKRAPGTTVNGQAFKDAEAELTRLIKTYDGTRGNEARYGQALIAARQAMRDMLARSNPAHATELQAINTARAQLGTLERTVKGGSDLTKATGIVTPGAALRATSRAGFRDPMLEAATKILPNRTPDSGTARRAFATLGVMGGTGGTAGVALSPFLALPTAAASLYTKPGMSALNSVAFGNRGAAGAFAAKQLENLSKYAPGVTVAAAPYLLAKSNE